MFINYKKILAFILNVFIVSIVSNTFCMQFEKRTPTHQTGTSDEGFRWRNSLNFTINGQGIHAWWIAPLIWYDDENSEFQPVPHQWYENNFNGNALSSNVIHEHLSSIAWNARLLYTDSYNTDPPAGIIHSNHQCVAAAALTVIVQDPQHGNRLNAFSCIIADGNDAMIAVSTAIRASNVNYLHKAYDTTSISRTLLTPLNQKFGANLEAYSCTEGQLINRIFSSNLFAQTVTKLANKAKETLGGLTAANVYDNIVLVTLHIHTTWDPCAKCSRLLAGVSKQMNSPEGNQTVKLSTFLNTQFPGGENPQRRLINRLRNGDARFLIEVSSNEHYTINADGADPECSHTECVGRDVNIGNQINITTGNVLGFNAGGGNNQLAIPMGNGQPQNWYFHSSFPPYVVYKRIGVLGIQIHGNIAGVPAPLSGLNNGCTVPQPHAHGQYNLPNI